MEPTEHFGIYVVISGIFDGFFKAGLVPLSIVSSIHNPRPHLLFHQTRTHLRGVVATPRAISLLGVIELHDKDQQMAWDDPNPKVCQLTYLGQPLTFQVRSNKKGSVFGTSISSSFSSITSSLFEIER